MLALHVFPAALHIAVPLPLGSAMQHPPFEQRLPGQHGFPSPPQAEQVEDAGKTTTVQIVLLAVQVEFAQHAPLAPPQVPHAPLKQVLVSGLGQAVPLAVQRPLTQHPLLEQALPAQQAWPDPPQAGAESASAPAPASASGAPSLMPAPPSLTSAP